ncbi:MAG: 2-iminoacetate synthase ThiH, partial [Candidatus Edwardsbacteria bacterium]|nr:2-iminoacetate synthase ThiH [Candidatus Edwardsbacteria bacterium]
MPGGFAAELADINRAAVLSAIGSATAADVEHAIARCADGLAPDPEAALSLLSPAAGRAIEDLARAARAVTLRRFGRTVSLYAPLYLSNYCANACAYCGFNAGNEVARRALTPGEVIAEAQLLRDRHISQLLLVTGESPRHCGAEDLAALARDLKPLFPSLAVEVQPLGETEYRSLAAAGVDGLAVYQETYDRAAYARVHPAGPKRDFDFRLAAPERGGTAGFRQLGIGALLGLDDWRIEACCLARHAAFLMKRHWKSQVSVSFPRLRPAAGGFQPPHPVGERELAQMVFALRLALPDAGLVLSTRESASFRDHMIGLGITRMSAGSRTAPGGYCDEHGAAEGQFAVSDERPVAAVAAAIRAKGYDPVWKDWDAGF